MKTLVDTSVWIAHLKKASPELQELLAERSVLGHSAVIGELACGGIKNRDEFLGNLKVLPRAVEASHEEVLELIEIESLSGLGLGYIDVQLLASALISGVELLTFDKALQSVWKRLKE